MCNFFRIFVLFILPLLARKLLRRSDENKSRQTFGHLLGTSIPRHGRLSENELSVIAISAKHQLSSRSIDWAWARRHVPCVCSIYHRLSIENVSRNEIVVKESAKSFSAGFTATNLSFSSE